MGHYDNCREGYCPTCGAAPGNLKNDVCPFCELKAKVVVNAEGFGGYSSAEKQAMAKGLSESVEQTKQHIKNWLDKKPDELKSKPATIAAGQDKVVICHQCGSAAIMESAEFGEHFNRWQCTKCGLEGVAPPVAHVPLKTAVSVKRSGLTVAQATALACKYAAQYPQPYIDEHFIPHEWVIRAIIEASQHG